MALVRKAIVASIPAALCVLGSGFPARALEVGQKAPDFALQRTKGGKLKVSDLRGKNVLINFYRAHFDLT